MTPSPLGDGLAPAAMRIPLPFEVHRGDIHHWYIRESSTGELKGLPFATRRAARAAVDEWNARRVPRRIVALANDRGHVERLAEVVADVAADGLDPRGDAVVFWAAVLDRFDATQC